MIDPAVAWIAALAAGLIFAASAAMKLRNLELFESAVINYRILPEALARPFAYLLPLAELVGALAVLLPASRAAGASVLLVLMAAFTIGIVVNLMRGRYDVDCGCFGPALRQTLSWWLVLRNGALAAMVALLLLRPESRALTMLDRFTIAFAVSSILVLYASLNYVFANIPKLRELEPAMLEALIVSQLVLWVLVLGLAVTVLALLRQIGVLHERITPMGALTLDRGPKEGEPAPVFDIPDLLGRGTVRVGGAREGGRSLLVMFVAPSCPVCKKLLPIVRSVARSESDWLETVLASDGDLEEQRRFVKSYKLDDFPYVLSGELGMTYRIGKLPYGVLIDGAGVIRAKGLINTREHLESLMQAKDLGVASIQEYLKLRETGANGGTGAPPTDKQSK